MSLTADPRHRMRLRLQGERGAVLKEAGSVRLRFALAYPHTYHVGMSNLGLQTIYRLVNQRPDALCERVFLPDARRHQPLRLRQGAIAYRRDAKARG